MLPTAVHVATRVVVVLPVSLGCVLVRQARRCAAVRVLMFGRIRQTVARVAMPAVLGKYVLPVCVCRRVQWGPQAVVALA
jgi:hypothetical protein